MTLGWSIVAGLTVITVVYIGRSVAMLLDDLRWMRRRKK